MTDAEKRRQTMAAIFSRRGHDGRHTRLFSSLERAQREWLASVAVLRDGELPVIGSLEGVDAWFVITTERVVWLSGGQIHEIATRDLRAITPGPGRKDEVRTLHIETVDRQRHTIAIEEGAPLSGVWNVLLNLCTRNRRSHPSVN
jgi:hypothetical protein